MKVLILCNGEVTLIDNTPKQLVSVPGGRLLDQTIRRIRELGVTDITLVATHSKLVVPGVDVFSPGKDGKKAVGLSSSVLWSKTAPTVLLLGDVYYSDAALETILTHPYTTWTFFCRFGYNEDSSLGGGEGWAVGFRPEHHEQYLSVLNQLTALDLPVKHFWQHYRMMNGADPSVHQELSKHVIIDDLTEDFDCLYDYITWLNKTTSGDPGRPGEGIPGPRGPKGDSVTAGSEEPSSIIPGVSVYIDASSGTVYRYDPD